MLHNFRRKYASEMGIARYERLEAENIDLHICGHAIHELACDWITRKSEATYGLSRSGTEEHATFVELGGGFPAGKIEW